MPREGTRRSLTELARNFAAADLEQWLEDAFVNVIYVICAPFSYLMDLEPYSPTGSAIGGAFFCFVTYVVTSAVKGNLGQADVWGLIIFMTVLACAVCWAISRLGRDPSGRLSANLWGVAAASVLASGLAVLNNTPQTPFYASTTFWLTLGLVLPMVDVFGACWLGPYAELAFLKMKAIKIKVRR